MTKDIFEENKNNIVDKEIKDNVSDEKSSLIGASIKIHEHGFVRLVDLMGCDSSVVQAARVSYGAGTKTPSDDKKLIRYMLRHRHTSPFEMCEIKLHIKVPMFIARQWLRHRTANVNEYSGRYSILSDQFYYPSHESLRRQSSSNKQGREGAISEQEYTEIISKMQQTCNNAYKVYEEMLQSNIAREIARTVLPANIYTEFYWKIDAHNLMHFLKLRCAENAQEEIREYALAIRSIFSQWMPITSEAFMDYIVSAKTYSGREMALIAKSLDHQLFNANCDQEDQLSDREMKAFRSLHGLLSK